VTMGRPSIQDETCRRVRELIESHKLWGRQLAGERAVAEEVGVSRMTLRHVLARLEAEGLLERRHGAGTFVRARAASARAKRTANLAVLAYSHHESAEGWDFRAEMIRGILGGAGGARARCTVLALDRPEESARIADSREMRRFDGFISVGVDRHELLAGLVALRRGPVVLLDGYVRGLPVVTVVDAGHQGMRTVTRHLLGLGHRRIAFLDCHNRELNNPEKFGGYRSALAERGIAFDEDLVAVPPHPDDAYTAADPGRQKQLEAFCAAALGRLLALSAPPTAIIGFDDRRALLVLQELERRGLRAGEDLSVAGFGDQAARRKLCDRLTSSRIYPRKMGRAAVAAAAAAAAGPAGAEGRTIFIPTRLMVRGTTCPAAPAAPSIGA
jgi:LacI family transcriptional regulator